MSRISEQRRKLLPLLPHLAVLLEERHVSRAAARVGVTQPSMSRALSHARELFDDQLLIRTASGTTLTPRGDELRKFVAAILKQVDGAWERPAFVPREAHGTVRFAATDYVSQLFLPGVVSKLRREAPGIVVESSAWSADALRLVEQDHVQFGMNPLGVAPRGFYRRRVGQDRYVVAMAAGHPLAKGRLGLGQFIAAAHVLTVTEGGEVGIVDRALRKRGKRRYVGVRVRDFTTALAIVGASDMIVTVPERLAARTQDSLGLTLREVPLALPAISIDLIWHERRHHDPMLEWIRRAVD